MTLALANPMSRETEGRPIDRPETRLATRLAFLVAGFGLAAWAPLVPYARERVGADDGMLGLLLLSLGVGSLVAMPMTGILSARFGSKPIIVSGALGMVLFLPLLTVAATPISLGLALFVFGAALGSLDVAMNMHAVEVEKAAHTPLMSGFHALFSIGGFAGALVMTFMLMLQTSPLIATLLSALVMLISTAVAAPRLLRQTGHQHGPLFEMPRGIVVILAGLTAITFLVEGAMLDWSALLLTSKEIVEPSRAGFGYVLFAIAMTAGRLCGDVLTAKLGDRRTLLWGGIAAVGGFVLLLTPISVFALAAPPISCLSYSVVPDRRLSCPQGSQ
jgi:MFS family permease